MGNKTSHTTDTSDDVLKTFQTLINMEFDDAVAMEAANKYPKNIQNKAIDFAINAQSKIVDNTENKSSNEINDISLNRLLDVLEVYKNYNNGVIDMNKLSDYINKNKQYIINDYHHILHHYLNEDIISKTKNNEQFEAIYEKIKQKNLCCDVQKCTVYTRNNRERETENILDGIKDKDAPIYIEILDSIHCYFIHSVDIGYRILHKIEVNDEDDVNNNCCYDKQLSTVKSYLHSKRKQLQQSNRINRCNKFMSDISRSPATLTHPNPTDDEEESKDDDQNDTEYSFGVRYDYWGKQEVMYDHRVKKKYESLKEEMISNELCKIKIDSFTMALEKAQSLLLNSDAIKSIKNREEKSFDRYGLKPYIPIAVDNVLAIAFYTDFGVLSYNFSATFRKLTDNESDEDMIRRNREYFHWSKILTETVNCFGIKMEDSNISVLYHGVSFMYFVEFIAQFDSPTSTTTALQIATIFAKNDGIILELKQDAKDLRYFNCSLISNFANENERLFIQPSFDEFYFLRFASIRNMSTDENYGDLITALTDLSLIVDEERDIESKLSIKTTNLINGLMDMSCLSDGTKCSFPQYMVKSFEKWTDNRQRISIDLTALAEFAKGINILDKTIDILLQFDKLNMVFKQIEKIYCHEVGNITDTYISLLLSMLDSINKLKYSKLREIQIIQTFGAQRVCSIMKYGHLFEQKGWNIGWSGHIIQIKNPQKAI